MEEVDEIMEEILEAKEQEDRLMKRKLGFLPTSLWIISGKPKPLDKAIDDEFGRDSYSRSVQGREEKNRKGVKSRLSQFHPEVARRCILLWSKEGDVIYDPFNERCPRIIVANYLKRHAIGTDICEKFQRHNIKKIFGVEFPENTPRSEIKYEGERNGYKISLYCCDSRSVPFIPDNSVDMIFCSPPYFNVEYYGDEEEQLGYGKAIHGDKPDYGKFLNELKKVAMENYRVLKPGKFLVWVVADIRTKGEFISFSSDCINMLKEVGFKHWDTVIYDVKSPSVQRIRKCVENGYTAKYHEYILVFKKPEKSLEDEIFG